MFNFSIFSKPLCRFLIQRYIGQYLKTEITSDQLEIRLADGTATVQSVLLNTEYINEILVASGLGVVSLVDSYVRELSLSVPWKKLPSDSTLIRISGLQLTLEPILDVNRLNTQELVASLIGSIASSMDLAKSFIVDEQLAGGSIECNGGIEQFASVIDQIIARIKFIFEDIVIRIESYSVESGLCTGMEIQVDRMEFLDENLYEQCDPSGNVVTEQPGRNSIDLNKLLKVKGVRLYTDIWTPRQNKLNSSQIIPCESEDIDSMGNSSLNFQSCYSHFSTRSNSNTTTRSPLISPSPILFAQLFTETHTVRIRTNNNATSKRIEIDVNLSSPLYTLLTASQMCILKNLFLLLLPKVKLSDHPTSNLTGGMPMREEHFSRMINQMQGELVTGNTCFSAEQNLLSGAGCFINPGSWSGIEPQFFDISEVDLQMPTNRSHVFHERANKEATLGRLGSNSLKMEDNPSDISTRNRRHDPSTAVDFHIDIFDFSIHAPAALLFIVHEDPLSVDSLKKRSNDSINFNLTVQATLNEMSIKSDRFFGIAKSLKLDMDGTNEQKKFLSNLYLNSHLRILTHGLFMKYSITNNLQHNSIEFVGHLKGCEISEILKPSDYQTHLLVLSHNLNKAASSHALSFRLNNSSPEKKHYHEYTLLLEAGNCQLEIDPIIIDRFGKIFTSHSFFYDYKNQHHQNIFNETSLVNHGLLSDLLEDGSQPISISIVCDCNHLLLVLKSPDFNYFHFDSESDNLPFSGSHLHTEILQFEFDGVQLELPKSVLSDLEICGTINLKCRTLKGSFIGKPTNLKCGQDQMNFIFVETTNADKAMGNVYGVRLKFAYDMRDKSLSRALLLNSMNLPRSMPESIFNPTCATEKKIEGLFSFKDVFHFKDDSSRKNGIGGEKENPSQMLIKAGSRAELLEFAEDCRAFSNFVVDFTFANVNLAFPSQEFFHFLFNRFLLDLIRWKPKFLKFCSFENAQIGGKQNFIECHSAFLPFRDFEDDFETSFDEESGNKNSAHSSTYISNKKRRLHLDNNTNDAHNFSLGIHFERTRFLIKIPSNAVTCTEHVSESQLGAELLNGDLFIVNRFKGSPNINYMFLTSSNAQIFHKNLFDSKNPFGDNVLDTSTFVTQKSRNDLQLSEIPKDHQNFEHIDDDNFVCSLRTIFNPESNSMDILLAIGLRNSLLYFKPVERMHLFWPIQFLKFFECNNLANSDSLSPFPKVDLRFHCTNVLLGYDHCSIQRNSPFQLRFEVGSSYIRTYLTKDLERLSIDCIFEDLILWMRKKPIETVTFEPLHSRHFNSENIFIKILASDSIHFVFNCLLRNISRHDPIVDFACTDQNLTVWLCSDTLTELVTILMELYNSETLKTFLEDINLSSNDKQRSTSSNTDNIKDDTLLLFNENKATDDQQLIREMESALTDMPPIYRTNEPSRCMMAESIFDQKMFDAVSDESGDDESLSEHEDSDEFTFIEMPNHITMASSSSSKNGIGITKMTEGRFHTNFDAIGGFEFIAKTIRLASVKSDQDKHKLPSSVIKASYKVSFSALKILIFGGSDFCNSSRYLPQRSYSQCDSSRREYCSAVADGCGSKGGRYRDHTVFVEIKFTKLSTVCKFFNEETSSYRFSFLMELGDLNILDHLSISHINEMIHRLQIEGQPRSQGHFLKIFLQEDQLREAVVRISLSPIRLNLDQDTFDFIVDFKNQMVQFTKNIFENLPSTSTKINRYMEYDDVPVMELPQPRSSTDRSDEIHSNLYPELLEVEGPMSYSKLKEQDETNLENLFSEDDVDFNEEILNVNEVSMQSSSEVTKCFKNKSLSQCSTSIHSTTTSLKKALAAKDIFIKDFSFSPACLIRVDYEAKRIRTDQQQSAFLSLLLGMTNMKKAELVLKEIRVEKGFLGARKCLQFVVDEWKNDIIDNQLRNLVGGVAMINAVVLLAQGLSDLITYPLEEYQKVDGQLSRGIQKGTTSFGLNAASAAIDATQRMMGFVHNVAEFTYDILNPNFAYQHYNADQRTQTPGDLREGFSLACNTVKEGFSDTAQTLQLAAEQDRARGGWGVGILRHVAPTAVRPIVIAAKATVHMLGGLKNQLKPEEYREEMRKWRNSRVIGEQLQRQMSTPSLPSSLSGSSFTHISHDISQTSSSTQINWQTQK